MDSRLRRCRMIALAILLSGCGEPPAAPEPGPPARVDASAGDHQTVDPGATLPQRLTALVRDQDGVPVPGVPVVWAMHRGTGTLDPATGRTDIGGKVSTTLHLTSAPGDREVGVAVASDTTLRATFTIFVRGGPTGEEPDVVIAVGDNFFRPSALAIGVNQLVEWRWSGETFHNIIFDTPGICSRATTDGVANSVCRVASGSGSWRHRFTEPGTFRYRCSFHPGQTGTVIVN